MAGDLEERIGCGAVAVVALRVCHDGDADVAKEIGLERARGVGVGAGGDAGAVEGRVPDDARQYLLIAEVVLGVPAEEIARWPGVGLAESALAAPAMGFGGVESTQP